MRSIAVISSDKRLNRRIAALINKFDKELEPAFLDEPGEIIEFLNYDFPEIHIINATDAKTKLHDVIELINEDPWLHYGGTIGIYKGHDEKEITELLKKVNLIALIRENDLDQYLSRTLRILRHNRSILFQRDLHSLLKYKISGELLLKNDPFDLTTYSNLLANFLYNSNLIDREQKERFYVAVMELLFNAIEHGNCQISFEEKSQYLSEGRDIIELIREKNKDPEIQKKRVYLNYKITPKKSTFRIWDEGEGFDWRSYQTKTGIKGLQFDHGRGLLMAAHYLGNLTFNDTGNEVSFEIEHLNRENNILPEIASDQEEIHLKTGDQVFTEGEESSHLYYIVSGKYDIIADDKKISTLDSGDIFLGEMSFLLNNRRSATVKVSDSGTLIKISKKSFINAVKEKPHYGVFLARLLSQRLVKLRNVNP